MKKIILLIGLFITASFSVQAAGQYPSCKDYNKAYVFKRVKNNPNIKYQLQQGWEFKGMSKPRYMGMVNSYAGTKECSVAFKTVKAGKRYDQLVVVNYGVSYRKDRSVQTDIRGISIKQTIHKNKR